MEEKHPKSKYDTWHRQHSSDDDITAAWHQFVKKNLQHQDTNEKKILEIGCGRGGFSNYLANLEKPPHQIFACDYSRSALDIARDKYAHAKITWSQQDIMALNFQDETFDTAISCETIEHVSDPAKAISELYRVLKPGGKLLLTCPNYFNLFGIWCIYRWAIGKPFTEGGQPYVNYILVPKLFFWIRKSGFKIEKFFAAEIIIPWRIPIHFYDDRAPRWLKLFGYRTFYILRK